MECRDGMVDQINKHVKSGVVRGKDHIIIVDYTRLYNDNQPMSRSHIKPSTFFTGFWDAKTSTHNMRPFTEAGVGNMLDSIRQEFEAHGYSLKDVSDPSRSKRAVLRVDVTY